MPSSKGMQFFNTYMLVSDVSTPRVKLINHGGGSIYPMRIFYLCIAILFNNSLSMHFGKQQFSLRRHDNKYINFKGALH